MFGNNLGGMMGGQGLGVDPNAKKPDTSEQIIISSLALLKMLKHGTLKHLKNNRTGGCSLRSNGFDAWIFCR